MAFFSTNKALVPDDSNGSNDIYRWKEGEGVALVTDGVSTTSGFSPNHTLGGTDASGSNVVFSAFERLVPEHIGGPQVYTARAGSRRSRRRRTPVARATAARATSRRSLA